MLEKDRDEKKKYTYYKLLSNALLVSLLSFFIHVQNDSLDADHHHFALRLYCLSSSLSLSSHTLVSFCPSTYILGGVIHSYALFAKSINSRRHLIITYLTRVMIFTI